MLPITCYIIDNEIGNATLLTATSLTTAGASRIVRLHMPSCNNNTSDCITLQAGLQAPSPYGKLPTTVVPPLSPYTINFRLSMYIHMRCTA